SSLVFHSHFRLDFIIYGEKSDAQGDANSHEEKMSIFQFPGVWGRTPLAFWGQRICSDILADETGESGSTVPRVRSLPFGVRLLPSNRPKVKHENLAITCCFVPKFSNGFPLLHQTIHLFVSCQSKGESAEILLNQVREKLGLKRIARSQVGDYEEVKNLDIAALALDQSQMLQEARLLLRERVSQGQACEKEYADGNSKALGQEKRCRINLDDRLQDAIDAILRRISRILSAGSKGENANNRINASLSRCR
ncbi:MAG: hypothetical protein LBD54_01265, partial [Puniceicoccales bacterium]|nr:hypothetical protein [Puniceicoccales bacterium]